MKETNYINELEESVPELLAEYYGLLEKELTPEIHEAVGECFFKIYNIYGSLVLKKKDSVYLEQIRKIPVPEYWPKSTNKSFVREATPQHIDIEINYV